MCPLMNDDEPSVGFCGMKMIRHGLLPAFHRICRGVHPPPMSSDAGKSGWERRGDMDRQSIGQTFRTPYKPG